MTQDVRTRPIEPSAGSAVDHDYDGDDYDGRRFTLTEVSDRIWKFFISKKTALALILAMGLLSLAGTLLQQAPEGLSRDPQAYQQWLDSVRGRYAGWTTPLNMLGLFQVFSSIWFKAVTLLLATSILACSVNRTPRLWRAAFRPRTAVPDSFFDRAPLKETIESPTEPDEAITAVRRVLHGNRFHVVADPDDPHRLYADRFRFGPFGAVIAHLSFIVILLGVLLTASTGFKETNFAAPVGAKVSVGHGTGLTVEAKSFTDEYYTDGAPKDYASVLALYEDGTKVKEQTIRVNQPMRYGGVAFYQSSFGTAIALQVKDADGSMLYDSGVPLLFSSDDGRYAIGQFELAEPKLTVYVVEPSSGRVDESIAAGQVQLEIYRSGGNGPSGIQVISQGKPTTIDGLSYTFVRERQFTGLIVRRDPGATFVWLGAGLMVLGLFMVFFFPHRRMWVRVRGTAQGSRILCGSPMRRDSAFESQFRHLTADITRAGVPDAEISPTTAASRTTTR
jgi:cytochrome c biogenesis protein